MLDFESWTSPSTVTSTPCGRGCRKQSDLYEHDKQQPGIGKNVRVNDNKHYVKVEEEMHLWFLLPRCLQTKREQGML